MGIKRIRVVVGDVFEVIIGSDEKKYFQYIADDHLWKILCKLSHFVGRLKPTLGIAAK